jgi:hypothetical protein
MAARFAGRTTAAAIALAVAVLSGCSEEKPASDSLPEPTAETTSSEALPPLGPADLPMPAEARTQDGPGAEAFVRYYIELINRTSIVMDAAPLREFSEQCADCERIARDTDEDAAAGYQYEGGELEIVSLGPAFQPGDTVEVGFVVNQAPLQVVDSNGAVVEGLSFPEYFNLQSGISARWSAEIHSWLVTSLTLG